MTQMAGELSSNLSMSSSETAPLLRGAMGPLRKQPSKRATSWAVSMNSGSHGHWKNMKYQDLHKQHDILHQSQSIHSALSMEYTDACRRSGLLYAVLWL